MNMSSHSEDYNRKDEMFKKGLIEIDEKCIEYFKPRPITYLSQKHDRIISHFKMQNSATGQLSIDVYSTALPLEIKNDLLNLFNRCWG